MCSISMASAKCSYDFEVNQINIKGGSQSGRKVVTHDSKSDLPLAIFSKLFKNIGMF